MHQRFANMRFDQAIVVQDAESGMPIIAWVDLTTLIRDRKAPSYACTIVGFDDVAKRDAYMAASAEARDNATVRTVSSPAQGGPHVVLEVHLDQPIDAGATYDEAVTGIYEGRGRLSGGIDGGTAAWIELRDADRCRTGFMVRDTPDGSEVAWIAGGLGNWLDPDLSDRLDVALRRHGLRPLGGLHVGRIFPGEGHKAAYDAGPVRDSFAKELDGLCFAATARGEARALMADPAVPRILRRLERGCLVFWGENPGEWKRVSSYQVRPGEAVPYKVSGDHIGKLHRLGAVERVWESVRGHGFFGCAWTLVRLTDQGRALLAGDVVGVENASRLSLRNETYRKPQASSFVEAVEAYAAGLKQSAKEALHDGLAFPKTLRIQSDPRAAITPETMNLVLLGIVSGKAVVTEDGRLRPAPVPKRKRASLPVKADDEEPTEPAFRM